jgi:Rrf2 family protein
MHYGDGPVQTASIAYRQGIPEPYLERLMSTLNKSGFVHSRRGPQGGHLLARAPREINLYDIMQELDGNASPLDCLTLPTDCMFADSCAQKEIWQTVEDSIQRVLESTTLDHLAERQITLINEADLRVSPLRIVPAVPV